MTGRAQSSTVGVVLLTAVVVVSVGIGGTVVLDRVATDADTLLVDATIELTATDITVTHAGGDSVALTDLAIVARSNGSTERYGVDAANVSGDGNGLFEPSERFQRVHGLTGRTADVLVIHVASNAVLVSESLDVGTPGGGSGGGGSGGGTPANTAPDAQFTVSNTNPYTGDSITFDATASSDADGDTLTYRWDFGDGMNASGETVQHTYDSAGTYTAELTVEDTSGATDTDTGEVVVSAPEIRIDSTTLRDATDDDGTVGPGQSVTVTATVSASGTTVDSVTADASAFGAGTVTLSESGGSYERTFTVTESATDGQQSVTVTASDGAGNDASEQTGTVRVDTTPPTVDQFEVSDNSFFIFRLYQLGWSVSDVELSSTTVYVNETAADDNSATYTGASGDETYFRLGNGQTLEIKLIATDAAGNQRCVVVTDTADGSPNSPLAYSACS